MTDCSTFTTCAQSAGKITADKADGLRLTHNYVPDFSLKNCRNSFITANVFEKTDMDAVDGWSDYNAYAGEVPAGEKNSFAAKAELGKDFTFKNSWRFDGRAIDSMPVGPYRRQPRNVRFVLDKPEVQLAAPDMVIAGLTANIPVTGTLLWGVCPCNLLLQWRTRGSIRGRGAYLGGQS